MKRAFYDFSVSPFSYDFAVFLLCAKANDCTEIVLVPGERAYQKCTPAEQEYRLNNLILGLCPKAIVCQTREEAKVLWHEGCFPKGYTVDEPVASHLLGNILREQKLYPFTALKEKLEEVEKDNLKIASLVTITMRDTHIKPGRNSTIDEWIKAADWMASHGFVPVFIPDTENPDRKFGLHKVSKKAAMDVQYRLALYDSAALNLGVNNGPMALCFFSRRPMLYFRPITAQYPESTEKFWAKSGIQFNSQAPWFTNLQRIIWEGHDDFENIKLNVERWLHARDGKKEAWPMAVAPSYPIFGAVPNDQRGEQMAKALKKAKENGWKQMQRKSMGEGMMSIACFGPSLKYTYQHLKRPILSVSGAHDFLIARGIVPDYHMDCDPREHKAEFTKNPHKDVTYLMATVCHPKVWENLKGQKVELWHLHNGPETSAWVSKNDPGANMIGGGSTAGMRALEIGSMLGYRRYEIHGMDCSFEGGSGEIRHAGPHVGKKQNVVEVFVDGSVFKSSPQMIEASKEMITFIQNYDAECTFYGEGLQQSMVGHFTKKFRVVPLDKHQKVA